MFFSFGHYVVCPSVFWPLCCLSFCLLAIMLSVLLSFGHYVVCPSVFWPLCCLSFCLLAIMLSVLLSFGHYVVCPSVFWPLCCLSFCLLAIMLSVLLSFGHYVVCPSSKYGFWLPLWYLQTLLIILALCALDRRFECRLGQAKDYRIGISWTHIIKE